MGRQLYESQPLFRQTLDRCDALLRPEAGFSLREALFDPAFGRLDQTAVTQPALFALEYALAQVWRSFGIEPDRLLGHSLGEYVAACVAGVFGLEEGLRLVAARGRLMQGLAADGAMVAVRAGVERVAAVVEGRVPSGREAASRRSSPSGSAPRSKRSSPGASMRPPRTSAGPR
jgi:acyl transferase domain-containing protein